MTTLRAAHLLALGMFAVSSFAAEVALAQDWKEEGNEDPPPDGRSSPKNKKEEETPPEDTGPPPRFLAELKIGPAFILATRSAARGSTEFSLQVNVGYAFSHDAITKGDAFYLTLSPFLVVGADLTLVAPLGLQYDLPLKMINYKGLYAFARASVGYAFHQQLGSGAESNAIAVQPALGARITFAERFHVGIEPFGFDVIHTFPPTSMKNENVEDTIVAFQISIFGGARF
jgi:hypothetical protein